MADTNLRAAIAGVLAQVLELPEAACADLARSEQPKWDSLRHLELVFALEDTFGVRFSAEEIAGLTSVASIAEVVRGRLAA